jgi:hypothetical protein
VNTKFLLKWGAILLVVYFAWQWLSNAIAAAEYTPGDNGLYSPSFAAPIWYGGPVTGWYAPWQRPWRPKRGR